MNSKKIPLIKEYRVDKLKECIRCIDRYAFHRDKQKECVLNLYPNNGKSLEHRDKSIFRGMIIPSLRYLGLIVGYGDSLKVSANGKLIIESQLIDKELHNRASRAVFYELDKIIFHFIEKIIESFNLNKAEFFEDIYSSMGDISDAQKKERANKWLSILNQVELIKYSSQKIARNQGNLDQTLEDIDVNLKEKEVFKSILLDSYFELSKDCAGIVEIVDLREKVSVKMLKEYRAILTENQFDEMLRKMPFENDDYLISLGKPMGAREKLFEYKGNYYKTLFIKTHKHEVPR
ncbi:MAG: hypothetical protein ACE5HX_00605 [bacterium]